MKVEGNEGLPGKQLYFKTVSSWNCSASVKQSFGHHHFDDEDHVSDHEHDDYDYDDNDDEIAPVGPLCEACCTSGGAEQ